MAEGAKTLKRIENMALGIKNMKITLDLLYHRRMRVFQKKREGEGHKCPNSITNCLNSRLIITPLFTPNSQRRAPRTRCKKLSAHKARPKLAAIFRNSIEKLSLKYRFSIDFLCIQAVSA